MLLSRFLIKFTMTPPLPNDPPRNAPFASIFWPTLCNSIDWFLPPWGSTTQKFCLNFHFRKLLSLKEESLDPNGMVSKFLQLVRSGPFFKLLCVFTDLDLASLDGDDDAFLSQPSCLVETRQWKHGCFTILEDSQFEGEACLDCIFNVGCEGMLCYCFFFFIIENPV